MYVQLSKKCLKNVCDNIKYETNLQKQTGNKYFKGSVSPKCPPRKYMSTPNCHGKLG